MKDDVVEADVVSEDETVVESVELVDMDEVVVEAGAEGDILRPVRSSVNEMSDPPA